MTPKDIPVPIKTPRLTMRPLERSDAEQVFQFKKESWPEFLNWGIWVHPPFIETRTVEDDEAFCAIRQERFEKGESIDFIALDNETGRMIGNGGLKCDWDIPAFVMGYSVSSKETGKGYGTEIAVALTKYAFEALGAKRVSTFHADGNIGSQRIIEKTGFIKEGTLRKSHNLYARGIVDEHHYGLLKGEFKSDLAVSWGNRPNKPVSSTNPRA